MSSRPIMVLAVLAGFFLALAGVTFFFWQSPSSAAGSVVAMAAHLSDHQGANFLYVISAGSIVAYGVAYVALGHSAVILKSC